MSKRNHHGWNDTLTGGISKNFMRDELGPWTSCPKRNCGGTMTDIYVRYVDHGPIFKDQECTYCGKVRKDPCTFEYFKEINQYNREIRKVKAEERKQERPKRYKKPRGKRQERPKRIFTNRVKLSKLEVLTNPRVQAYLYANWCKGARILTPRFVSRPRGDQHDTAFRKSRSKKRSRFSRR